MIFDVLVTLVSAPRAAGMVLDVTKQCSLFALLVFLVGIAVIASVISVFHENVPPLPSNPSEHKLSDALLVACVALILPHCVWLTMRHRLSDFSTDKQPFAPTTQGL